MASPFLLIVLVNGYFNYCPFFGGLKAKHTAIWNQDVKRLT
jgi:hypothetical protein